MGRKKLGKNDPCPKGHVEGRNTHGQCVACRRLRDRGGKHPVWLLAEDAKWLSQAHLGLKRRKRNTGLPAASKRELWNKWVAQGKRCALTGMLVEGAPHLDHILPVSAGGTHAINNLQWVHPMANWAKNKYPVEKFEDWLLAAADALRARRQLKELI
jgi:hypothetical protein